MNRYQLLELLVVQTERADRLQARLEEAEKQLSDQFIQISSLGSIAEASLQLSGVFESAQKAAELYVKAAQKRAEEIEQTAREQAAAILAEAEATAGANRVMDNESWIYNL